jgi:hypothetical protein
MNQHCLSAMASFLNSASWNYSVFLQSYNASKSVDSDSRDLIRSALGDDAVVDRLLPVTPEAVIAEVTSSLCYAGDDGAGPNKDAMKSARFKVLLASVVAEARAMADGSLQIEQFWIKDGHPAYPVFWDFAYLFTRDGDAVVLIGSSSD